MAPLGAVPRVYGRRRGVAARRQTWPQRATHARTCRHADRNNDDMGILRPGHFFWAGGRATVDSWT
ncbi:MAG: hypothetical protein ACI9OJ_003580 [Myxococcota bacterium]|jgi:hypothetical protein